VYKKLSLLLPCGRKSQVSDSFSFVYSTASTQVLDHILSIHSSPRAGVSGWGVLANEFKFSVSDINKTRHGLLANV
jgi:hypothetical protein